MVIKECKHTPNGREVSTINQKRSRESAAASDRHMDQAPVTASDLFF